jgi:hypothetical protein
MMYLIAAINFCYAPLMFFLRTIPGQDTVSTSQAAADHPDQVLKIFV